MFSVIKWEMKKNLKLGTLIIWVVALALAFTTIRTRFDVNEVYADVFSKYYGLAPVMGIIMFAMFSGSFVNEYESNVVGLVKASRNGKKQLVLAKFIANGIIASIINLSIFGLMIGKTMMKYKTEGLSLPLKDLWYFGNSGSNITVLQMILIVTLTVILGSFLFAALGVFLSAINKRASIPFIFGGLLMGSPYLLENFVGNSKIMTNTPLWGMYSQQLIRYKASISAWVIFGLIVVVGIALLYNFSKKAFLKER